MDSMALLMARPCSGLCDKLTEYLYRWPSRSMMMPSGSMGNLAIRCDKSLLLGITLKEHSVAGFRQILSEIKDRLPAAPEPVDEFDDYDPDA